ncbi:MAG: LD-carboxypeptidase, partial [Bacilli bacterium]|nr:LD-carboxypeptidase [Bacilli bacterium]
MLPYIDFENIKNNPKIFLGMSDITVLLCAINKMTGLITFHCQDYI